MIPRVLVVVGLVLLLIGGFVWRSSAVGWVEAQAVVVDHDVEETRGGYKGGRTVYRPVVAYRFSWEGKEQRRSTWHGNGDTIRQSFDTPEEALEWARQTHPVESSLEVSVDPASDPVRAAVVPGSISGTVALLLLGGLGLSVIGAVGWGVRWLDG